MSQHDFNIANQGFPSFRSDLNNALAALASLSAGGTEPSTTYANQLWYDTANNYLKYRNEANSDWIVLFGVTSTGIRAIDELQVRSDGPEASVNIKNTDTGGADPDAILYLDAGNTSGEAVVEFQKGGSSEGRIAALSGNLRMVHDTGDLEFFPTGTSRFSTSSSTPSTSNVAGASVSSGGSTQISTDGSNPLTINRLQDGVLISFRSEGAAEGNISVSGTTVSYNGGHLSRWAQFPDNSRPELLKGTVMSNLDQMSNWSGEDNEQLNCVEVSAVEGDANVAGVFVAWDSEDDGYNDILLAMTGDMVIRIAGGTTVQRGDLLMSAGDGTAKPQGDDIVRAKTIAKVTSTHVSHTYADGSYAVPCVLMAC